MNNLVGKDTKLERMIDEVELSSLSELECQSIDGGIIPLVAWAVVTGIGVTANVAIGCVALGYAAGYVSNKK